MCAHRTAIVILIVDRYGPRTPTREYSTKEHNQNYGEDQRKEQPYSISQIFLFKNAKVRENTFDICQISLYALSNYYCCFLLALTPRAEPSSSIEPTSLMKMSSRLSLSVERSRQSSPDSSISLKILITSFLS